MTLTVAACDRASDIALMSAQEALDGFEAWLKSQATEFAIGGMYLARLDELGIEIVGVSDDMLFLLRSIGRGRIAPEVVTKFSANTCAMQAIATLSLEDQRRLCSGGKVDVAEFHEGQLTHRALNPAALNRKQIQQVIRGGKILPPEQQVIPVEEKRKDPFKPTAVRANPKDGTITVGNKAIDTVDVRVALKAMSKRKGMLDPKDKMSVSLPRELVSQLKVFAAERQCTVDEFIWSLLQIAGL